MNINTEKDGSGWFVKEISESPMSKNKGKNPIHQYEGKWWFWDECWSYREGPWTTKEDAERALSIYAQMLEEQTAKMSYANEAHKLKESEKSWKEKD